MKWERGDVEVICVSVCWRARCGCSYNTVSMFWCSLHVCLYLSLFWMGFRVYVCAFMFMLSPWQVCAFVSDVCVCQTAVEPFSALPSLFIRKWWWGVRPHLIKEKIPSPINLINPTLEKERQREIRLPVCVCVGVCVCVCVCACVSLCSVSKLNSQRGLPT